MGYSGKQNQTQNKLQAYRWEKQTTPQTVVQKPEESKWCYQSL